MKLYLVQHGEAKKEDVDPERSLTESGIEEVRKTSNLLKKMGIRIDKIYHSGKKRAYQTAKIFSESLNAPCEESDGLNPLDDVKPWYDRIQLEEKDIMIVGHLPFLEKLSSKLLCEDENKKLSSSDMVE